MNVERDGDHKYWLTRVEGGPREQAIGVTRTLVEANLIDDTYFSDKARGRGRMVHHFVERIATNTLDKPIDVSVLGQLIGFRKFLDTFAPEVHNAETILINPNRLLAGTIDLDVTIGHAKAVIEIKPSSPVPWHSLQLCAYSFLLDGPKWMQRQRLGLYLSARGGFRLKEFDEPSDLDYFLRAHELLHWRIKHGSHERPYGKSVQDLSERDVWNNVSGRFMATEI